jgi:DNA-binding NarL/FixJ family response regulator
MSTPTVFVAEGQNHVRAAIRLKLTHQPNFKFHGEAENTENLLAKVCQNPPDVILLDWALPGMNPQRLIPALRTHCPHTFLVAVSVKPEEEKSILDYQMDGFVSKQLSPDDFMAALEQIISK